MKLLGVEFVEYACFDRYYVPLDAGLRLLAGKNNSGKTALLRGLNSLRGLPFRGRGQVDVNTTQYCRVQSPYPFHRLNVWFQFEGNDDSLLGEGIISRSEFTSATEIKWKFHFLAFPQSAFISLRRASLLADNQEILVLDSEVPGSPICLLGYNSNRALVSRRQIDFSSGGRSPDGFEQAIYEQIPIFAAFGGLLQTRIVSAHRVVTPNLNLQALDTLSDNAGSLGPYLDTVLSNDREKFDLIQSIVTEIFPEFRYVNPHKSQNGVSIVLTKRSTGEKIPLTHCGTGVEQVLAIATFVLTTSPGTLILLDEPHSYLHPTAERQMTSFLAAHSEHRYVVATHSMILINSVAPDRILSMGTAVEASRASANSTHVASVLHSLGYQNSDLLFNDRLVLVEGESDQEILPILLSLNPRFSESTLNKTGYPTMGGEGKLRGLDRQRSLLYWEKFVLQLGKGVVPRVYLFDGGCIQADRSLLEKSNVFSDRGAAHLKFLRMNEIENYLLVPQAIFDAMEDLLAVQPDQLAEIALESIVSSIEKILSQTENKKLYPDGVTSEPRRDAKGSVVLEMLFSEFKLRYEKRRTGRLIATKITVENQPLLKEIWELLPATFFPTE